MIVKHHTREHNVMCMYVFSAVHSGTWTSRKLDNSNMALDRAIVLVGLYISLYSIVFLSF